MYSKKMSSFSFPRQAHSGVLRARQYLVSVLTLVLALTGYGLAAFGADAPDPAKPGPFPVGVTTMLLVDHSRTDPLTEGPRTFMTEIWYPAAEDAKDLPKNKFTDFFVKGTMPELLAMMGMAFGTDLSHIDETYENFAVRDARVCENGKFPLVLFSHGNGGLRCQNAFWCEHMASHGYIVAAPDHTGNCAITTVDGKPILFNDTDEGRRQSSGDRPKDLSFIIDTMGRFNKGGDSRFLGKLDLERIGVAGHSFGGYTSTAMADQEPRVDAIAPMAAVGTERTNYECPVMVVVATEDDTIGVEGNARERTYYDESKGPRHLVEFKNAGHFSFTEMYQLKPDFGDGCGEGIRITNGEPITYISKDLAFSLTNGYVTAFFGRYLKDLTEYDAYLSANHNPDELIVKADP